MMCHAILIARAQIGYCTFASMEVSFFSIAMKNQEKKQYDSEINKSE